MKIKVRKHHILLSLGAAGAAAIPLAATVACGEDTGVQTPKTDQAKIEAARALFTSVVTAQTLTSPAISTLPVGQVFAAQIAALGGAHQMPDISSTGATVTYAAAAPSGLVQVITATIAAGSAPVQKVEIKLTFSSRTPTASDRIDAALNMFNEQIKTQTLTATINHSLDHNAQSITRAMINSLAGLTHPMPDTSGTGATVTYAAAAPSGLAQVVTATITASGGVTKTVNINLTFKPYAPTAAEKIQAAFDMFTNEITTQTVSATIDSKLDHTGATTITRAMINSITGLTHPIPDTSSTGATVTYTAAVPTGNVQVVTALIAASGAPSKTVSIRLTFQPHVPTAAEKIQAAFDMFTNEITTQTVSATIDSKLDHTGTTTITRAMINSITGLTHPIPDTSSTGATVTYTAAVPTGNVQVVTALIAASGATSKTVSISLTFQPHVLTNEEKVQAAVGMFSTTIKTQNLLATVDSALDHTLTSIPVNVINTLAGIVAMPDISSTGATVTYTATAPVGLAQTVTATITAGQASQTVTIALTFAEHVPTADEKITAAFNMFTNQMKTQTLQATIDSKLDEALSSIPRATINALSGITPLPATENTGATVTYTATAPNALVQVVRVSITATGGTARTFDITLTFQPHVPTDAEKIQTAADSFTQAMKAQTLTVYLDHALAENETSAAVIDAALITKLPTSLPDGVSVAYHVGGVDRATLIQNISVTISAGTATPNTFQISLTYAGITLAAFKSTYPNKISADGLTIVVGAFQNATLLADFALPETVTTIDSSSFAGATFVGSFRLPSAVTTINNYAFERVTFPSGFFLPSSVSSIQKGGFRLAVFPAGFTIPTSVINVGDSAFSEATLPAGFAIPATTTIVETPWAGPGTPAPSFRDAHLPAGYAWRGPDGHLIADQTHPVPGCSVSAMTDAEKIQAAHNMFTSSITTQTISATITNKLDETATSIPVATINALTGITHMPDIARTGATVTYTATAPNGLVQVVTATIAAGTAQSQTVTITLTFTAAQSGATDAEKIQAAADSFTPAMKAQTLTVYLDQALAENETSASVIDAALITKLPASLPSGVSVTYHVGAVDRATLIQNISVTISAGTATPNTFQISLTYAGITLAAFKAAYPSKISANGLTIVESAFQSATLPVGFALPETVTLIDSWAFVDATFAGSFRLPSGVRVFGGGAFEAVTFPSGFFLPSSVSSIGNSAFRRAIFLAGFTIPTSVRKIEPLAFQSATLPAGFAIPASTTIEEVSHGGPGSGPSFLDVHLPAGYAWRGADGHLIADQTHPVPGCSVSAMTDAEKIQAAHNMFTSAITTQTISATITNKLDETATSIPVATINALTGITHMPDISGTGATVTYTATAPNGLVQVVTATIAAGTAQSQTVSITLTFQPHVPTDAEKIQAAHDMFTSAITTQTISATITNKLDETATSIPVATINALTGITHMPDISGTGATVTYTATAPNGLVQVVTATIAAGTAQSQTVTITLTFTAAQSGATDAEKIQAAADSFTPAMKAQTLTVYLDHALAENETSAAVIDAALITKLPASLPSGVSVTYHVGAVDRATLIQNISVTISAGTATSNTFQISLTYAGITLAAFKAAYPNKISADGLTIVDSAFLGSTLPAGFALPETVTTIDSNAFWGATFAGSFRLPSGVTNLNYGAFKQVTFPSGFFLPSSVSSIGSSTFRSGTLPTGFTIPTSVRNVEAGAFYDAALPGGFAIPATTTIVESSSSMVTSFSNAHLPAGYAWRGSDGHLIADQTEPVPGCSVSAMNDAEKIQVAHNMFTSTITTQTISATITNKLDETATSISVTTINALTGITHMPDISGTGATVTYTATAPNGLVQVVTATITAGTAQSQTVTITLTFTAA